MVEVTQVRQIVANHIGWVTYEDAAAHNHHTDEYVEVALAVTADLQAKLDKAVEALQDIKNPIAYLEREAEKSGAEGLNSNAVILAKDYAFLQLLATNALAAIKGSKASPAKSEKE